MRPVFLLSLLALAAPAADRVTFSESVAPIIYRNCVSCHRPGEAAPFSLISYDDVRKRGALIAMVTGSRFMPPWHAEHGYGEFEGERRLTDSQIAIIAEWVKQGMPEGDRSKMPSLPRFTEGWQLGKPDLILEMPAGYEVPAGGPDIYRNFVIPTGLAEDKWVRAVEFRPSARKVVHHVLFASARGGSMKDYDGKDGKPGFTGMIPVAGASLQPGGGGLGGWAVGTTPAFLAGGMSVSLPKGSDFVLEMHFHPTGKPETERSLVGLYFAEKAPERRLMTIGVPALFGVGNGIEIPSGEKNYAIQDSTILAADVQALGVAAHAHYLGKEFKATATLPDGTVQPLVWIRNWDFNWQEQYTYKRPLLLPKGTRIDVSISWDNSTANPRNPSRPPQRVLWGEQTFDEMGGVGLMVTAVRQEDEALLEKSEAAAQAAAIAKAVGNGTVRRILESQARARAVATARLLDITIFDRQGKAVRTVGEPGVYTQAAFSPDGSRIAVIRSDRQTGNADVWVYDIDTGKGTAITSDAIADSAPVWSADGTQIAYVSSVPEGNYFIISRKAADGTGAAQLLYKHTPGEMPVITDWSADGTLWFWAGDWTYTLVAGETGPPVKLVRGRGGRLSPDGRTLAYNSTMSGRFELYTVAVKPALGEPVQITKTGAVGGIFWRQDGKELFFMANPGQTLTALDVTALSTATPTPLFKVPAMFAPAQLSSIGTRDGQRFVFLAAQPLATANAVQ
jgi:hypothetical protein